MTQVLQHPTHGTGRVIQLEFSERLSFARKYIAHVPYAEEFALRVGVSVASYNNWENGTKPRDKEEVAKKIELAFPEISAEWLLLGGELRMKVTDCAA